MLNKKIRDGLWQISTREEDLRVFGTVSFTETGRMYNTYLMDTGHGYILLGAFPARFAAQWRAEIQHIVGSSTVGWAVLFGTDDDRTAASMLLETYPDVVLIGGSNTLYKLRGFVDAAFRCIQVRTTRNLVLGKRKLTFQVLADKTPSLYVLDREQGVLLTADAFGSVCAPDKPLVSELVDRTEYLRGAERYFADIFGPNRAKTMKTAIALVRENGVRMICPAQGPVVDAALDELISIYTAEEPPRPEKQTLAMIYAPGNYVRELAQQIAAGVQESGDVAVETYDLSAVSRDQVLRRMARADAFIFGTPEIWGDAAKSVWDIVTSLRREDCSGKRSAVLCSTNSKGSAVENLRQRLQMLGFDLTLQDHVVQGKPDAQALKNAYEYGFGVSCSMLKIPNPRKPKLVRCPLCGEIFDASLGTCPVCGLGVEQCVPVEEDAVTYRADTDTRYVILGGGIAALSAAEAIRQRDGTGSVTMLSAEPHLPINRPMLTKDFQTISEASEMILVHEWAWYTEREIDVRLSCRVAALDVRRKTVTTDSGAEIPYDKLIYAMGAECFVPPFAGHDKPGVLTIRHLSDNQALMARMKTAKTAVVIGGGVLGLEAASELMRAGIQTTVLEATPQIVGRLIDAQNAAILKRQMEAMHVACYEGVSIAAIEGETQATGVRLSDGRVFPADFVIVSCGNRANVQVAQAAGIQVDRAIVVNQRMETSAPDVYACGDCAQLDGVNFQLWQEASDQGRVAGANAAGEPCAYANQVLGLSLEGFGTSLYAIGDPGKRDLPYRTVETADRVRNRHETYWFYGGSLQGAVLIGAPEKTADIQQAVITHARYDALF